MLSRPLPALLLLTASLATHAGTGPVEESFRTGFVVGKETAAPGHVEVQVLVVRPADKERHPIALLLHGRGVSEAENLRLGRADFPANARYFAARGYAVVIPTRIGYGITGGPDLEYTGTCAHKTPQRPLALAAQEMNQVFKDAARHSWADRRRIIVVGDSFGGLIALALAADPPKGLRAVVNVSGGDGGDSLRHVDTPCDPTALADALREFGKASRLPALFLYSANDRFWGHEWPERWYAAWRAGGGRGSFERLVADKNNGHFIFNRNAEAWHGPVERYLQALGLP